MRAYLITVERCRAYACPNQCHAVVVSDHNGKAFAIEHHRDEKTAELRAAELRARAREIESAHV